jgi:type 1 glutamine amidotransferase
MMRFLPTLILSAVTILAPVASGAQQSSQPTQSAQHVLAIYTDKGEQDHIDFANDARRFFADYGKRKNLTFESTTTWDEVTAEKLKGVQLVMWLNDFPHTPQQRKVFEDYMARGGAWLGFHVAAYNDESTHWPWFVEFLGGTVFFGNNWPPLPAKLIVDDRSHPVTQGLPATVNAPANEWYIWRPSARLNKEVRVLLTLAPENYPIGLKDTIAGGDCPVVWTNTRYRMLYVNMGHGDKIFAGAEQNRLFGNAVGWLLGRE